MAIRWPGAALHAGQAVNRFEAASLPRSENFASFKAAIDAPCGIDTRFVHAAEGMLQIDAGRLARGTNWFGAPVAQAAEYFRGGSFRVRQAETLLLHDAIFSPSSTVVCSTTHGLYDATLQNFLLTPNALRGLAENDGLYEIDGEDVCRFTPMVETLETMDRIVIPICGTGFHNYGHFLYDGLPAIFLLLAALRGTDVRIIGPGLATWQAAILRALDLLDLYVPLAAPVLCSRVLVSSFVSLHVPYPTRFARPVFDAIRFKLCGAGGAAGRRVWISRQDDTTRRLLTNRAEVEAVARRHGFEIVMPHRLEFEEQVRLFGACSVVAGESGAGMANIGFCDPGTRVLEIQPVAFIEGWTRAASAMLGLEWNVLFAEADAASRHGCDGPGPLRFRVDLDELSLALERVTRG